MDEVQDEKPSSVSVSMPPDLHQQSVALAARNDLNFSQLVRKLLREHLEREAQNAPR